MADINVERKGPSVWPWIIGLLVLALLIWAIAEMVDTDETQVAGVEEVEPAAPPAAVPAPTMQGQAAPVELQTLMPLGTDDAGRMVNARGTVVGQPLSEGYWILTDQDAVVFVLSKDRRDTGEAVQVTGRLAPAAANQVQTWRQQANLKPAAGWTVQEEVFIAPVDQAQQGAPGAPQPGDTAGGAAPTMQPGTGTRTPGTTQQTP